MIKVNRETSQLNRKNLTQAADRLARRDGLMRVSLADIAKEAGLTTGAVYARYKSREILLAAGIEAGFERMVAFINRNADAASYVKAISEMGRDDQGALMCPAISHVGVIRFASAEEKAAYKEGLDAMIGAIEKWPDIRDQRQAAKMLSRLMGAALFEATAPEYPIR